MKKIVKLLFFLILTSCIRVDESMKLFFPEDLKELQYVQTQFSAFWWNFIIIENDADFIKTNQICEELQRHVGVELRMAFCGSSIGSARPLLKSWADDIMYRKPFDKNQTSAYRARFSLSAVQASYMSDPQLFSVLRNDPFQTWQDYLELSKNSLLDAFEKKNGSLYDPATKRVILPIQFRLKPEAKHIQPIMQLLKPFPDAFMIGSHGATYRNQKQVQDDLQIVSVISGIVFVLFMAFLVFKSRMNTLFLVAPVGAAIFAACLVTQWIDGSVHGLTLAFGSCIVGLAMDYGLHGAFGSESKQTWTSNTIGLLTTLTALCILILSGIPLIRQMMIFSTLGLAFAFLFFYILFRKYSESFKITNIGFFLPQMKGAKWFILFLVAFSFYGMAKSELKMDLRKLSFVSEKESAFTTWFFSHGKEGESFLLIKPLKETGAEVFREKIWALQNGIHYEGISKYVADLESGNRHLRSWATDGCDFARNLGTDSMQKIFNPFATYVCSLNEKSFPMTSVEQLKDREYLKHLYGDDHLLSIFSTPDEQKAKLIQKEFPTAKSLTQGLKSFSVSLEKDLIWMMPAALLLTLLILSLYYKKPKAILTAMLPFFSGLGFYFLASTFIGFEIDLISILGLVMVFGFSIDYGVFSTDVHIHGGSDAEIKSVYSALTFAAVTNILGFLPMLFAGHPVLSRLGAALFYGTVGTYLGAIYGVYPLYEKKVMK